MKSLEKKITLGFVFVCMISILSVFFVSFHQIGKSIENQMKHDGRNLAFIINKNIEGQNINNKENLAKIQKMFENMKEIDEGELVYISLQNTKLEILAHTEKDRNGTIIEDESLKKVIQEKKEQTFIFERDTGEKVCNVSIPIYSNNEITGILNIGISLENMYASLKATISKIALISMGILIIAIIIGIILSKRIVKPLKYIMKGLKKIEEGDLTVRFDVKSKDEIEQLAKTENHTLESLDNMFKEMKDAIENLNLISQNLSSSSQEVSSSMEEVASSADEVASGAQMQVNETIRITKITEILGENLEIIYKKVKRLVKGSEEIETHANQGNDKIEALIKEIEDISNAFDYVNKKITHLAGSVTQITEITNVINSVAGQTNLLALNASIESARAGEAGRGFAVVAEEIRKLAEQVLNSSKDIKEVVEKVTSETEEVSSTSNTVLEKVKNETISVEGAVKAFKDILEEISDVNPHMEDLFQSIKKTLDTRDELIEVTKKIEKATEEFSMSANAISTASQQQASMTEELSASAENLADMSNKLEKGMNKFKL